VDPDVNNRAEFPNRSFVIHLVLFTWVANLA